ncbi:uncharacterized protein A4U43_C08F19160 [Asparagus officinalis]|nr:uncharacterized protein A4U43_C08F19160 [Asparagus officinalis]
MAASWGQFGLYYRLDRERDRDKLKESLDGVLTHYPAMTGDCVGVGGKWGVKCNDRGVRIAGCEGEGGDAGGVVGDATAEEEAELAYWEEMNPEVFLWSPFYIQGHPYPTNTVRMRSDCCDLYAEQ